jgi:hypothetical protein
MGKLRAFWKKMVDILDDFLAYALTVIGILYSSYMPQLKNTGHIIIDIDSSRIVLSLIMALLIISKQEKIIPDKEGNSIKAREGRKNKFLFRMINALGQGVLWATINGNV